MTAPAPRTPAPADARAYRNRLRRLEGQIRGITGMVEHDRPCIDTLTQISATIRALEGMALALLNDYLRHAHATGVLTEPHTLADTRTAVSGLVRT